MHMVIHFLDHSVMMLMVVLFLLHGQSAGLLTHRLINDVITRLPTSNVKCVLSLPLGLTVKQQTEHNT